MTEFVEVSDWVWHNALRALDPTPSFPDTPRAAVRPIILASDYPRKLVESVLEYLSDDLFCDHQVGICMCGIVEVVKELNLNLAGKKSCGTCGGEGFNYDQAKYEAAKATQIAEWGGEEWWDIGDSAGYVQCESCAGKGTVAVGFYVKEEIA